jgi:hypothetical protein
MAFQMCCVINTTPQRLVCVLFLSVPNYATEVLMVVKMFMLVIWVVTLLGLVGR